MRRAPIVALLVALAAIVGVILAVGPRAAGPWMASSVPTTLLETEEAEGGRSFAGLGAPAEGFAQVRPGVPISFPEDLGAHPGYRIEWWYVIANLEGPDGEVYGAQWTLFRQALAPSPQRESWASQQFWMAHAAVTTADRHLHAERLARGGVGQAGATVSAQGALEAWLDHWRFRGDGGNVYRLAADGDGFAYGLAIRAEGPFALQGDAGYSVKSDQGQASYYYSQPFFAAAGTLSLDGREIPVRGRAWMDREWSSQPLAPNQEGWDWVSLHLANGEKIMLFRLRHTDGGHYFSGNWITEDGLSTPIDGADIRMTPGATTTIDGRVIPTEWRLQILSRGVDIATTPLNPNAWNATNFAYWEGPIRAEGSHPGVGYLEMTGY